ncbi:cytochrome c1, heme protein, mitochondrial-like isoform X2 [Watersipora subatra]
MAGWSPLKKIAASLLGVAGAGAGLAAYNFEHHPVQAADLLLHSPKLDWHFHKTFGSYDVNSLRRGYLVYKNVCKACHSVKYLAFREMVDVFMTEDEAKAEAEEVMIIDGPDETGEMFERPGKLSDKLPNPYRNDEEAKFANDGGLPPDLSYITRARHGEENYVFAILTGYCDPPAGYSIADNLHYNPYFAGGAINMAQALYPGIMEYPDGTPASVPQLAKDVTEFLSWISQPELNTRKEMGIKFLMIMALAIPISYYWKRQKWASIKNMKFEFRPPKPPTREQSSVNTLRFRKTVPK